MGFLDAILGRSKPAHPNLDALFALPSASITLQASMDMAPTGLGSVCYRAAQGGAFANTQQEIQQLLDADDGPQVRSRPTHTATPGCSSSIQPEDMAGLATELHAVNTTLQDHGFGSSLLCSLVGFRDSAGRRLGLVYLYKQGTFYPFAPLAGERRDSVLEMQVKSADRERSSRSSRTRRAGSRCGARPASRPTERRLRVLVAPDGFTGTLSRGRGRRGRSPRGGAGRRRTTRSSRRRCPTVARASSTCCTPRWAVSCVAATVRGPLGLRRLPGAVLLAPDGATAYVESAQACGLQLVTP